MEEQTPETVVHPPADPPPAEAPAAPEAAPADPPPPAPPPTPAPAAEVDLAEYDAETHRLICEKADSIAEAMKEWADLNEEAKAAKKVYESRQEGLVDLIKERREGRGKPVQKTLLDFARKAEPEAALVKPVETADGTDPLADLWRQVPLTYLCDPALNLGCRPKDIDILAAGVFKNGNPNRPLQTMGELADFTAGVGFPAGYAVSVADFRGIGPGGATRIADASAQFWVWWGQRGGKDQFARERGLLDGESEAAAEPGPGAGDPVEPGGEGDGGEPAGPAAEPGPADEPAVEPEAAGEDGTYSLGD